MKKCPKCELPKRHSEFHKSSGAKDGLQPQCKDCQRAYRVANKDRKNARNRIRRQANRDQLNAQERAYYARNRDQILVRKKAYNKKHRKKISAYVREYRKANPSEVIRLRISVGIRRCIVGNTSFAGSMRHLPYNVTELRERLSSTMPDGYTWDDIDHLHIDHIRPVSSFNIQEVGDDEFLSCWALDNLQLLPAAENMVKSNKWHGSP